MQKLSVNEELQEMLDRLERDGVILGIAVGRIKTGETENPYFLRVNHYIASSSESLPKEIMVNKSVRM